MKRGRFSVKKHQAGCRAKEFCRRHSLSETTFYRWRSKYEVLDVARSTRHATSEVECVGAGTRADLATIDALAVHFYGSFLIEKSPCHGSGWYRIDGQYE
ncbi:transposase [uncultured Shimia sp.]|uniref:IS66 family insertion sequence element accessory protein TnpA n=1 Tax=uncultured Shimia sp. TaxID=573152 RepID=UPI003457E868